MAARMTWIPLIALVALAACGGPRLDTRTFQLKYVNGGSAENLIRPYVFGDRPKAPGQVSFTDDAITVRETPDNLEKIGRVLADYDKPSLTVRLHFQVIQADGAARSDPAIAEVEVALRKLFRFRGYRLVGEAMIGGAEYSEASQEVAGAGGPYGIDAKIGEVRGSADSGTVRLETTLWIRRTERPLHTSVTLRAGQTAVLGNARLNPEGGTVILVVRPELVPN